MTSRAGGIFTNIKVKASGAYFLDSLFSTVKTID